MCVLVQRESVRVSGVCKVAEGECQGGESVLGCTKCVCSEAERVC